MHPEEKTKVGRIDLTIRFEGRVYILEFKVVE
jgi:predicted type IV restriction endonuclease